MTYDIPQAIQVAHYWKFKQPLDYYHAVTHMADVVRHRIFPCFLKDWLTHIKETTKEGERAPAVIHLIRLMDE